MTYAMRLIKLDTKLPVFLSIFVDPWPPPLDAMEMNTLFF